MAEGYKLCPKCSNALDSNVMQCPYCGEKLWISFWSWVGDNSWFDKNKLPSTEKKKSWCWCWCWCFFLFIFIIFSIILAVISSLLEELDRQELSEVKEVVIQELGDMLGVENGSDVQLRDSGEIAEEDNVQRLLNPDEMKAIDEFDEIFEAIEYLNYPKYQDEEGWDVELGTSTSESVNGSKKNIVILKYRWSEFERYFLQLDQVNFVFFFDDENNNIHRVTENEVLEDILPIFRESLGKVE